MREYHITTDEIKAYAPQLATGDTVYLSGTVYTSRDAAHKRIAALLEKGEPTPYPIAGAVIYYAGPTPTPPGLAIGSCGPTTSGRMDVYTPALLDLGLAAMVGKGPRSKAVCDAIVRNGAVYFCAVGGAGALYVDPYQEDAIGDGILRVLQNSDAAETLRQAGLENAKRFSWERSAQMLNQIIEEEVVP